MYDLSQWPYADEAVECLRDAHRFLMHREQSRSIMDSTHEVYRSGGQIDWKSVLDDLGIASGKLGISFDDLRVKCEECFRVYGTYGTFVALWITRFHEMRCFAFGRLEAEVVPFRADGSPVINIHIPSKGRLVESEFRASYQKAADFYHLERFVTAAQPRQQAAGKGERDRTLCKGLQASVHERGPRQRRCLAHLRHHGHIRHLRPSLEDKAAEDMEKPPGFRWLHRKRLWHFHPTRARRLRCIACSTYPCVQAARRGFRARLSCRGPGP